MRKIIFKIVVALTMLLLFTALSTNEFRVNVYQGGEAWVTADNLFHRLQAGPLTPIGDQTPTEVLIYDMCSKDKTFKGATSETQEHPPSQAAIPEDPESDTPEQSQAQTADTLSSHIAMTKNPVFPDRPIIFTRKALMWHIPFYFLVLNQDTGISLLPNCGHLVIHLIAK